MSEEWKKIRDSVDAKMAGSGLLILRMTDYNGKSEVRGFTRDEIGKMIDMFKEGE